MQADKSLLCAQALGARSHVATNTALTLAERTKAGIHGVNGHGVMKKVPENLKVSECTPANVQRQAHQP
jgi:hypothetical protein